MIEDSSLEYLKERYILDHSYHKKLIISHIRLLRKSMMVIAVDGSVNSLAVQIKISCIPHICVE